MLVDVTSLRNETSYTAAKMMAYGSILGLDKDAAFGADVADLLGSVTDIDIFDSGTWLLWLQVPGDAQRWDDVAGFEFVLGKDGLEVRRSSEYAPHVDSVDEGGLVTLVYRARKKPLPEDTDVSHPKWTVTDVRSSPTEVTFDMTWEGS